jgi:Protein of unknown function (DUF3073)
MGRGRAKAKQTKVARELKYSSGGTDLDALRKELASGSAAPAGGTPLGDGLEDEELEDEDDDKLGSYRASGSR